MVEMQAKRKRRRLVTSCGECHRRKQKCDRGQPCDTCIARNVPLSCSYEQPIYSKDSSNEVTPDSEIIEEFAEPAHEECLQVQMGYANFDPTAGDLFAFKNCGLMAKDQSSHVLDAKFYQLVLELPSSDIIKKLMDTYFDEANWWFMTLERHYVDQLWKAWSRLPYDTLYRPLLLPPELRYFPAVLYQVLAVGLQFLPQQASCRTVLKIQTTADCDSLSEKYSTYGTRLMDHLGRYRPAMTGIQADLMRAIWLKNCSKGTESWFSVSNAIRSVISPSCKMRAEKVRQAQEMGLHLQRPTEVGVNGSSDIEEAKYEQYRRRLWIRLFVLDSHMSFKLGRPRTVHIEDCDMEAPWDQDLFPIPLRAVEDSPAEYEPSSYTCMTVLYEIAVKIHRLRSAKGIDNRCSGYALVETLHTEVDLLIQGLPSVMHPDMPDTSWDQRKPHFPRLRQQISSVCNSFIMGLHRPHVASNVTSRLIAVQCALKLLSAQQRLFDLLPDHHFKLYGYSFYTIDAALFLSATVMDSPVTDLGLSREITLALRQAVQRLGLIKAFSAVARSGEKVITSCCQTVERILQDTSRSVDVHIPSSNGDAQIPPPAPFDNLPPPETLGFHTLAPLYDAGSRLSSEIDWSLSRH